MPKQGWNVGDRKTLRRMVGTSQEFVRSNHDYQTFPAGGHHDDVGVSTTIVGAALTAAPVGFPRVQDKFAYGFLHPSEHWGTGHCIIEGYFSSQADGATEIELKVDGLGPGTVVGAAEYNIYPATSVQQAGMVTDTLYELKWDLGVISTSEYDLWSWRIGRLGSSGTDDINGDVYFYLLEVEWFPAVDTA